MTHAKTLREANLVWSRSQGGCSFSYPTGDPCTEGDFNAFYIFVLWAIENFQRWINSLAGSVESTCEDVISYSGELVDTFSHTKTPSTKVSDVDFDLRSSDTDDKSI